MGAFRRTVACGTLYLALVAVPVHAQTATYHLHKEASTTPGVLQLKTAGPDSNVATVQSSDLRNQPAGEHLIRAFSTQVGVPNAAGTIPAGSVVSATVWIKKTSSSGVMYPRAKFSLNSAAGSSLCTATGPTALTPTATRYNLECTTSTNVSMTTADRFYLEVAVNVAVGAGNKGVNGELQIEGKLNGNYDSQIVAPLPIPNPTISSVSPTSGSVGTSVTISGSNLGATQGGSTVRFNGIAAAPSTWNATSITAPVPAGATTGSVAVTVNGVVSNGVLFGVRPAITSLSRTSGPVGAVVTISGTTFGDVQGSSTVMFNGAAATPTSWSSASITAPVPTGATTGPMMVTVNGQASNAVPFTVGPLSTGCVATPSSLVYRQSWTNGPAPVAMPNTYYQSVRWGGANPVDPVYPEIASSESVTVLSGAGPHGENVLDFNPAGTQHGDDYVTAGLVAGDFGPLADPSGGPSWWDATQGCLSVSYKWTTAAWNEAIYNPLLVTGRSLSWFDGGFTLAADIPDWNAPGGGTHGTFDLWFPVWGSRQGVNTYPFTRAATENQWQTFMVQWKNGTTDDAVSNVAPDGWLRVYWNGTPIYDINNIQLMLNPHSASAPGGKPNLLRTVWLGYYGLFGPSTNLVLTNQPLDGGSGQAPPAVTSLTPTAALVGGSITIMGTNFGTSQGSSTVTFNGTTATPTSWSATSIAVPVPSTATTGPVVVTVNGSASNGVTFTVIPPPTLTSVSPSSGPVGMVVTIDGAHFGTTQGSSTVAFDGVVASGVAINWSDTRIEFVPLLAGANGFLVVTVGGVASNAASLTVTSIGAESGQIASLPFVDTPALVMNGDAAWYSFAPTLTGWYRFSTKGTTSNTTVAVFTGAYADQLTPVAYNDEFLDTDGVLQHWSQFDVKLTADVVYSVKVQIVGEVQADNGVSFTVSPLTVGRAKVIVQSTETGTWVYDGSASPIRKIGFQLPDHRPPSSYEYVRAVAATREGNIWIASDGLIPRLRLVDPSSGSMLSTLPGIESNGYNYALREHPPSGDILVASADALKRYTRAGDLVTTYRLNDPSGLVGIDVTADGNTLFYLHGSAIKRWDLENDQPLDDYKDFGVDVPNYFALDGSGGVVAMWLDGSARYGVDANNSAARFDASGNQIAVYVNPAAAGMRSDEGGVAVDSVNKRVWIQGGAGDDSNGPGAALLQFNLDTADFINLTPTINQRFDIGDTGLDEWYDNNAGLVVVLPDPPCSVSLSSSWSSWPADGGEGFVRLSAAAGCQWTATADAAWLTVTASLGSGDGVIASGVARNTTGRARAGTLTIGGASFQIYQTATFLGGGSPGGLPPPQYNTVSADVTIHRSWVDAGDRLVSSPPPIQYHWERSRRTGSWKTVISSVSVTQKPMGSMTGAVLPPDRIAGMRIEDDEDGSPIRIYTSSGASYSLPAGTDPGTAQTPFNGSWIEKFVAAPTDATARRQALQQALGSAVDQVGGWDRFIGYAGSEMSEFLVDPQSSVIVQINVVRDGQLASQTLFVYEPVDQGPLLLRGIHGEHVLSAETGLRSITDIQYLNLRVE